MPILPMSQMYYFAPLPGTIFWPRGCEMLFTPCRNSELRKAGPPRPKSEAYKKRTGELT
jgi:hypothetical protein